ncbi:DUF4247 domain-containing protein [Glycomyces sp. L485]|uniref:DUF4247 domain-containing protein n=1 Tax=Glycomyces sp. L485 TaxID=2909235 RepID=UPI001F4A9A35|nr:DUF4247 domain-containing protein [Glycomyces sp. L485]MCH7231941.1 DUF4247 domain-containing protein [Glycomyces sp. L485]
MHTHGEQQPSRTSGLNWKHWLAIGIVVVLCCGSAIFANLDRSNPTGHIQGNYTRAAHLDEGRGKAYTSSLPPSTVADDIDDADDARDERRDGDTYFLQYKDHIVSVEPYRGGSKILLFGYRAGYQHYSSVFFLWGWSSSPPSPFRGGGPGSGK